LRAFSSPRRIGRAASTRSVSSAKASIVAGPITSRIALLPIDWPLAAKGVPAVLPVRHTPSSSARRRVSSPPMAWHAARNAHGAGSFFGIELGQIASQISLSSTCEDHCQNPPRRPGWDRCSIWSATASQHRGGSKASAMPGNGAGQLRQAVLVAEIRDHGVDGVLPRRVVGHLVHQVGDQASLHPFVDLREAGADPGLQREATQNGGAEGVDRLDLQPARRLYGAGKSVRARDSRSSLNRSRRNADVCKRLRSSSSGVIAQVPRRLNRRFCISIAAALV
jgi:hypothetical protein